MKFMLSSNFPFRKQSYSFNFPFASSTLFQNREAKTQISFYWRYYIMQNGPRNGLTTFSRASSASEFSFFSRLENFILFAVTTNNFRAIQNVRVAEKKVVENPSTRPTEAYGPNETLHSLNSECVPQRNV